MPTMDVSEILFDIGCPVNATDPRLTAVSQRFVALAYCAISSLRSAPVPAGELFDI